MRIVAGFAGAVATTAGLSFALARPEWPGNGWTELTLCLAAPTASALGWGWWSKTGPAGWLASGVLSCAAAGVVIAIVAASAPEPDEPWFDAPTWGLAVFAATGVLLAVVVGLVAVGRRVIAGVRRGV